MEVIFRLLTFYDWLGKGRGHWTVNKTGTQNFIIMLYYSLAQKLLVGTCTWLFKYEDIIGGATQ